MRYNNTFIIIVSISAILGTLFAIYTNSSENNQKEYGKYNLRKKNRTSQITNTTYNESNSSNKNPHVINNIFDEDDDDDDEVRNPIPIAISIDNKYTLPALVFLTSLMENIGPKTKYEIYIMTDNKYSGHNKNKFYTQVKKYGENKLKITFVNLKDSYIPSISGPYLSKATYYRVHLPYLLSKIDKILYLDVDMINFKDLSEIYNMKFKKNIYLYAMIDDYNHKSELYRFNIKPDKYINAGTLLMDLKNIRKKGLDEKLKKFVERNAYNLEHHDQTALNAVYYKNLGIFPIRYVIFNFNTFQDLVNFNNAQEKKYRRSNSELKEAYNHPYLIHYAGYVKPWQKRRTTFREYWWDYAKKCDFYKEILEYYSMSENEVNEILKVLSKK